MGRSSVAGDRVRQRSGCHHLGMTGSRERCARLPVHDLGVEVRGRGQTKAGEAGFDCRPRLVGGMTASRDHRRRDAATQNEGRSRRTIDDDRLTVVGLERADCREAFGQARRIDFGVGSGDCLEVEAGFLLGGHESAANPEAGQDQQSGNAENAGDGDDGAIAIQGHDVLP